MTPSFSNTNGMKQGTAPPGGTPGEEVCVASCGIRAPVESCILPWLHVGNVRVVKVGNVKAVEVGNVEAVEVGNVKAV